MTSETFKETVNVFIFDIFEISVRLKRHRQEWKMSKNKFDIVHVVVKEIHLKQR